MIYKILFCLGLCLLILAYVFAVKAMRFYHNGVKIVAIVADVQVNSDSDGTIYAPIFEYEVDGKIYRKRHTTFSSSWRNIQGEKWNLTYDPNDPNDYQVTSYWSMFLGPIIMTAIATVFLVVSGGYFWFVTSFGKELQNGGW